MRREAGRIVGNGHTLGPKSYPISLRLNIRSAGPEIHGQTGLARSNSGSDTCVRYALLDQVPEGAGSRSHMAHRLGRARLTSASPPRGPRKTPLGDEVLPMGCHKETTVWTVLGHRPRRFHTPIRSFPNSRESSSIESSLIFEGLISQSCDADIHSVHLFLAGTCRLILSAAAWGIHPSSCMGMDAFIASPAFNMG